MRNQLKWTAPAILVFALGCQSQLTGNEGNLVFSYTADDNIGDFNKPIAVGALLEVRVTEAGTRRGVTIDEVMTDDGEVLAVESFSSDRFIIRGAGDGNTLVEVNATGPDGEVVTDSVNMRASTAAALEMWHTCQDQATRSAQYLAGATEVLMPYDMKNDRSENVIGYGIVPWSQEPVDSLAINGTSKDQAYIHVDIPSTTGTITLTSDLDDTTLTLEVVDPGQIDGTEVNDVSALQSIIAEETRVFHFYPTVGGTRVCQSQVPMTVEEMTPETCEVRKVDDNPATIIVNESNWVSIKGLAQGDCSFNVVYPDGADGAGATEEFTIPIAAFADQE